MLNVPVSKPLPTFEELYREIERLPQGVTGQILEPGVLITMSRPGRAHENALTMCEDALHPFDKRFGGHGWRFLTEYEVRFPGNRLAVPDLAGWRVDRHPELPMDNPLRIVPDFCAEVLSPTTRQVDRALKLPLYASTGVGHTWLIDPEARLVEVYEAADGRALLVATACEADVARLPPFDQEIAVGRFWLEDVVAQAPAPP